MDRPPQKMVNQPDSKQRRVIICPLDWGIGHATRCIPVIQRFREIDFEVIVAGSGKSMDFIKREFPAIRCMDLPGPNIAYTRGDFLFLKLTFMIPRLIYHVIREHKALIKLVRQTGACLLISDNRYGCWHPVIPSVFITHQINIQLPGSLRIFRWAPGAITKYFIRHYAECWIPDFEVHNGLGGALSHPKKLPANCHYVGILSRFSRLVNQHLMQIPPSLDLVVMLSGPEPQRTMLEEIVLHQLEKVDLEAVVVRGLPDSHDTYSLKGKTHVFAHLETEKLYELLARTSLVLCRSGYSSIMDLVTIGKRAILIPTPGQTEQEYLARYLMDKKIFFSMKQENFDLQYALELSKNFHGMIIQNDERYLTERIREITSALPVQENGNDRSGQPRR
jgi:uncharacterized protein (TIGR00661 family)